MSTLYKSDTSAPSAIAGEFEETVYKVEGNIVPALPFNYMMVEANRDLDNDEITQLHGLVDYHWATVVKGAPLDDLWCNGYRDISVTASSASSFSSKPAQRMQEFIDTLNAFIASGSPERVRQGNTRRFEGMPNTTVSVWLNNVQEG